METTTEKVIKPMGRPVKEEIQEYTKKRLGKKRRDTTIGKLKAKGQSLVSIGRVVGLSTNRVATICQRDDVKSIIEAEQTRLASFVPQAVKNMEHWIQNATNEKNDNADKRIGYEATKELLQSTGILNNQPSHLVQILYNDNKTIINPVIKGLLDGFLEKMKNVEIIDADFEEVTEIPNS
jgi:hypothetical protein